MVLEEGGGSPQPWKTKGEVNFGRIWTQQVKNQNKCDKAFLSESQIIWIGKMQLIKNGKNVLQILYIYN